MLIRHSVCRFLEERGFIVESATNGMEALEILETLIPDLIITDLLMPKMDGREFIANLKKSAQLAKIPIVILSGRASTPDMSGARGDFVIYKDIEIDSQLAKAVFTLLGERVVTD